MKAKRLSISLARRLTLVLALGLGSVTLVVLVAGAQSGEVRIGPALGVQNGNAGWHVEIVDGAGGTHTSVALDGNGYSHISYYNATSDDLQYAYQDISGWHTETVDAAGNMGQYTSIAIDGDGYPHISYYDGTYSDLEYAYKDGGGWHTETVDAANVGRDTSIALDGDGYPHISYRDDTNTSLKYAYKDGGGWHTETADNAGNVGIYTAIALDGSGTPHISYREVNSFNDGDLKYAYKDAGGWHVQELDSIGNVGEYTSIAVDGTGYPHISYHRNYNNFANGELKYAYEDAVGWYTETVDDDGWMGQYTSIALDGSGYPHVSYRDVTNNDLKYAYKDADGWHDEIVDEASGTYTSIALDGSSYPHISYSGLRYAAIVSAPVPTTRYVDLAGVCNTLTPCYTNIGAAVAASNLGDAVYVFPGAYAESVDLTGMNIRGDIRLVTVNGSGSPTPGTVTVNPAGGAAFHHSISPFKGDVTINGFIVNSPDTDGIDLIVNSDVVIVNVTANSCGDDGIDLTSLTGNVTVTDSTANNNSDDGFDIVAEANVTIIDCTANGNTGYWGDGFELLVGGDLSLDRITAHGNSDDGVDIYDDGGSQPPDNVTVHDADLRNNVSEGLELDELSSALSFQADGSVICDNDDGLDLGAAIHVNAEGNWWGCTGGPGNVACDTVLPGPGTVDFTPWIDTIGGGATPVIPGQSTVVRFRFSGGSGAVFLGQGPGDSNGVPPFTLSTDNGTLTSSTGTGAAVTEFVNNAGGVLVVTLTPAVAGTATVTLDGPCGLDSSVAVPVWSQVERTYVPLVLRDYP